MRHGHAAAVALLTCWTSSTSCSGPGPAHPPPIPHPPSWCDYVASLVDLPRDHLECEHNPGYYTLGYFGPKDDSTKFTYAFYLPTPAPDGLAEAVKPGPPDVLRDYTASTSMTADLGLDVGGLPGAVSRWVPKIKFAKKTGGSLKLTVKLANVEYHSIAQVLPAVDSAIRKGVGGVAGSEGCTRLEELRARLCLVDWRASDTVLTATPVIDVTTDDKSSLEIDATALQGLGTAYSTEQKAADHIVLTSKSPLGLAVLWRSWCDDMLCKTAAPKCPAPPPPPAPPAPPPQPATPAPPPQPATCSGTMLQLPEARAYKITETSFDGGRAYRTTLVQRTSSGDAQIDTLPFNGSADRTVNGPAQVFVCSTNREGGAGGCAFQCTGSHPSFHFTYPAGDGFGDKHADLTITPQ